MACEEFPSGENKYFRSTISKRGPYGIWQGWVIWQLSMKAGSEARAGLPHRSPGAWVVRVQSR